MLKLDARIDVVGVLAHDDEVEVAAQVASTSVSLDRPDQGVEVEGLAERDVDAAEAAADGRRDRSLQRDLVLADRREHRVRERRAELGDRGLTCLLDVPLELDTGGFEDPNCRFADLRAHAVPRNQRYCVPTQSV